jgi:hypothetical protein
MGAATIATILKVPGSRRAQRIMAAVPSMTPMINSTKRNLTTLGATKALNEKSNSDPKKPFFGGPGGA